MSLFLSTSLWNSVCLLTFDYYGESKALKLGLFNSLISWRQHFLGKRLTLDFLNDLSNQPQFSVSIFIAQQQWFGLKQHRSSSLSWTEHCWVSLNCSSGLDRGLCFMVENLSSFINAWYQKIAACGASLLVNVATLFYFYFYLMV